MNVIAMNDDKGKMILYALEAIKEREEAIKAMRLINNKIDQGESLELEITNRLIAAIQDQIYMLDDMIGFLYLLNIEQGYE